MEFDHSFRFVDGERQRRLLDLVAVSRVRHRVAGDGTLHYSSSDETIVGNELIDSLRDELFPEWAIFTVESDLSAPDDEETAKYRAYMQEHSIPFIEEIHGRERWFLISSEHDSFEWKV
jgi:hypothetical protein